IGRSRAGGRAEDVLAQVIDRDIDAQAPGVLQLAETSSFTRSLRDRPLPKGVWATTISAGGDFVVPAGRARLAGARRTTLSLPGLFTDHSDLPGSPQAHREIALGLAGWAPSCRSFGDVLAGAVVSEQISRFEDMAGAALWFAGRRTTARTQELGPTGIPR
ncbi:MAG: hypothetical protein ACRDRT_06155, partial [Pseudonocardiaceae bacterium]